MMQMIYNDTSERSGCRRKRAVSEILLKRWEGLNLYTLNRWIKEMRENKRFSLYVINPTHKLVFINLEGFECFLRWKQKRTK